MEEVVSLMINKNCGFNENDYDDLIKFAELYDNRGMVDIVNKHCETIKKTNDE